MFLVIRTALLLHLLAGSLALQDQDQPQPQPDQDPDQETDPDHCCTMKMVGLLLAF